MRNEPFKRYRCTGETIGEPTADQSYKNALLAAVKLATASRIHGSGIVVANVDPKAMQAFSTRSVYAVRIQCGIFLVKQHSPTEIVIEPTRALPPGIAGKPLWTESVSKVPDEIYG